jgi:diguanylate cyclase (GGDEF)-like protein
VTSDPLAPAEPMGGRPRNRILVVDDDIDIAGFVSAEMRMAGFDTTVAHNGEDALTVVRSYQPDLVILDQMMPGMDGLEVISRLRADVLTSALPIIMLTARAQSVDKVIGLRAGADDYLVKPFDTMELVVRVRGMLRRNQEFRDASPLTGLPGNNRILREIGDRLRGGDEFAVCYCDIDGFKAVNDAYGFLRGDEFIVTLGRELLVAVGAAGPPPAFLGHIGGDDFVVICSPAQIRRLTDSAVSRFEQAADALYDEEDRIRRYVSVKSRRDGKQEHGLVTVSIGVALSSRREYVDPRELVAVASEMKTVAKSQPGSFVAMDRRTEL